MLRRCLFGSLACACFCLPTWAQLPPVPTGTVKVRAEVFATGFPVATGPVLGFNTAGATDMAVIPNGTGNLVGTNYGGQAMLLDAVGNIAPTPFLNLSDPTSPTYNPNFAVFDADGLVSLAFHPDFSHSSQPGYGKFYTLESEPVGSGVPNFADAIIYPSFLPHEQAMYEYTLDSPLDTTCDASCAASKREVFRVAQPGWHHNLGDMVFDDQGLMFISSGDGNVGGNTDPQMSDNAQLLTNIFGKILRIDPLGSNSPNGQYGIPVDNPFVGVDGLDEIYAYGLRNPYRLAFDTQTGDLFASEVGELTIESVERIVPGGNHGWNAKEGSFLFDKFTRMVSEDVDSDGDGVGDYAQAHGLVEPIFEYDHDDGRSVIGGVVYRGSGISGLQGRYVFADLDGGPAFPSRIFYGDPATQQMHEFVLDPAGAALPLSILSVNEDANGELYVLGISRNQQNEVVGHIIKLIAAVNADFDASGTLDCVDVDSLVFEIAAQSNNQLFDLTNDGQVNAQDLEQWLRDAGITNATVTGGNPYLPGDANLDGVVDGQDFIDWNANKFTTTAAWCSGDFNADGVVDGQDFIVWNANKFRSSSGVVPVPEPRPSWLLILLAAVIGRLGYYPARKAGHHALSYSLISFFPADGQCRTPVRLLPSPSVERYPKCEGG